MPRWNNPNCGFQKGHPIYNFKITHPSTEFKKGHIVTNGMREKIRQSKLNEKNPMWKGNKVGIDALHDWAKSRLEKPKRCENCRKIKKLDLANISRKYLRDLTDWKWLCRKCHIKYDKNK